MIATVENIKKPKVGYLPYILKLAIFCFTLLWVTCAGAQTSTIRGKVTDEAGKPIASASVTIKGTNTGTTTDESGAFSISVSPGKVLVISYVGYADQEITAGRENDITVTLAAANSQLNQVIVVGYGTQKRTAVTGAISSVNSKTLNELPVVNVQQALQGRVAGVQVTNNGSPGTEPIVAIRGISSISYASNPLYVVDGFPTGDFQPLIQEI